MHKISLVTYTNMSNPISWENPHVTCPHKFLVKRLTIEPNVKPPHSFPVGLNEIKNNFEMYGGIKMPCTIMVYVKACNVRG